MKRGFSRGLPLPAWGPSPQSRIQALEGFVEELWEILNEQEACHEDVADIIHDIEDELTALSSV